MKETLTNPITKRAGIQNTYFRKKQSKTKTDKKSKENNGTMS